MKTIEQLISNLPEELKSEINKYSQKIDHENFSLIETNKTFNLKALKNASLIVNIEKTNNFRRVNKFHEKVNFALTMRGIYISCAETSYQRSLRKWKKSMFFLGPLILFLDFLYKRVFPKIPIFNKIYFMMTRGYNRVMSETEIIGRLVSCGFEVMNVIESNGLSYYVSTKVREPFFDVNPSYGPIFSMKRVGKEGKIISVYKFRPMAPYSEYIQKKITDENKIDSSGKIKDDFRVTFYGKFLRKYWIDELPMIINWFKRDLKLVGVRPLSEDYFRRYPDDLKELRIKTKPGLVPPYYVDLPITFEEICESERRYLNHFIKKPLKTDISYFFKAFYNIIIKRKRSR